MMSSESSETDNFIPPAMHHLPTDFGLSSEVPKVSSSSHSPRYNQRPSIHQSPSDSSPIAIKHLHQNSSGNPLYPLLNNSFLSSLKLAF